MNGTCKHCRWPISFGRAFGWLRYDGSHGSAHCSRSPSGEHEAEGS